MPLFPTLDEILWPLQGDIPLLYNTFFFLGDFFATWQQENKIQCHSYKGFFKFKLLKKNLTTRIQGKKFGNHQFIYFILFETNGQY